LLAQKLREFLGGVIYRDMAERITTGIFGAGLKMSGFFEDTRLKLQKLIEFNCWSEITLSMQDLNRSFF
jgi:hypothetical protein